MAAGTSAPSTPPPAPKGSRPPSSGKFVEYDRFIEHQLRRTRRQVKSVDLTASLMLLAAGSMAYLLLAALADHWLVPGGMGFASRLFCLALFLTGVAAYLVLRLGPLVLRRINPIYAAQTIEQSRPGLKNSLVNFLLLRSNDALPQRVYEAIEEQAANGLSAAQIETAVDRTPLVKLLTLLMVLVGMVAVYRIASPKNPFTSFRRVIAPWADISAPTRVAISDIQPGEAEGYHDQHLNVSALISGLSVDEQPTLHYSTADGQLVDHPVRMTLPETGYRHTAELPADAAGLQQDLEYWITAGDAISPRYKVGVKIAPAIVVDAVEYDYPAYSELTGRSVPRRGDLLALEGTRVTVRATATHEIKSADIDFDCNGRRDLAMKIDGRKAYVTFTLALKKNREEPEHASYQIRFKNLAGHENPKPIRYSIEVVPDQSPEIAFVEPSAKPTEEIQLAQGASLPLKLAAADPDFKLADVRLLATRGVEPLLDEALLAEPRGGPFERRFVFSTRSLGLKAGDRVRLWASADDNKQPDANHVETPRYTLRIVSPDGKQDQDQLASNDSNKKQNDKPQNDHANDKPNPADRPSDGDDQQGDQKQPGENGQPDKNEKQKPRDDQPSDKEKEGQEQGEEDATADNQSAGKQSKGKKQNSGEQNPDRQDSGDGDSESGEGQPGESRQNGKNSKGSRSSSGENSDQQNDERVDPEKDAGKAIDEINKFFNDKKKEEQPSGENKQSGDKQPDKRKGSGDDKQPGGEKQPGDKQPGDDKQPGGEKQSGDKQAEGEESPGKQSTGDQDSEKGQESQKQDDRRKGGKSSDEPAAKDQPGAVDQAKQPAGEKSEKNSTAQDKGKQSSENDQPGASEQSEAQRADDKSPGKSGMKDDPQSKDDAGKQASGEPDAGAEKGAERKQPQAGEKPAGEKKSNEDDQQPGPGKGGGDGEAKRESQEKKPGEKGGKSGKSQADDQNSQEPGEAGNSGQDKSKQPGEQGVGDESKSGDEMPKEAEGDRKSLAGKNAGQSKGEGKPNDKQNADEKNPEKNAGGGDPEGQDRGEGGAGQKGGDNKDPAPSPMESNKQRDKKLAPDENSRAKTDEEYNSSSISEHQSDSKSDKSGEQSGGGGKGGGQRSQSPGKGSAGQNTDADEGGGQSEQSGKGPKSDKAGDQVKGEQPSGGKPSGEKGPGTNKRAGGSQAGGADDQPNQDAEAADDPSQQPGDSNEQQAGGKPSPGADGGQNLEQSKNRGNGPNNQTGGGLPPTESDDAPADPTDASEPGGDDPNLEYTRKATDLALERLKDQLQKGDPDQELLDRLKWSRKDVERFINRWDQLKSSAKQSGPQGDAAREELDETLRSLGLRPRGSSLSGGQKRGDQRRNLIESRRTAPPAEYAEQYREFSKGISRAKK